MKKKLKRRRGGVVPLPNNKEINQNSENQDKKPSTLEFTPIENKGKFLTDVFQIVLSPNDSEIQLVSKDNTQEVASSSYRPVFAYTGNEESKVRYFFEYLNYFINIKGKIINNKKEFETIAKDLSVVYQKDRGPTTIYCCTTTNYPSFDRISKKANLENFNYLPSSLQRLLRFFILNNQVIDKLVSSDTTTHDFTRICCLVSEEKHPDLDVNIINLPRNKKDICEEAYNFYIKLVNNEVKLTEIKFTNNQLKTRSELLEAIRKYNTTKFNVFYGTDGTTLSLDPGPATTIPDINEIQL